MKLQELLDHALNIIYPQTCEICGKTTTKSLCNDCKKIITDMEEVKIVTYASAYFNKHVYLFKYEGLIRQKILQYKFNQKSYLYKMFSELILENQELKTLIKQYDVIIPVPISKQRKKQRGYNQTELIANMIGKKLDIPVNKKILIKTKNSKPQSILNKEERKNNILGAYKIWQNEKIKNKNIIIFDDIFTTGSTAMECSKELRKAEVNNILVFTIAKD